MNFIHQDVKASIHDLMHFLRVEFLRHRGIIGHIRKENGHQLPLSFNGTSSSQDFVGKKFRGIGLRVGVIDGRADLGNPQRTATFSTEFVSQRTFRATLGTQQ
jgi:hypothetical protein